MDKQNTNKLIVGATFGAFDLLHIGHIKMLEECRAQCDKFVVGLHSDPSLDRPTKNKPVQTMYERYKQLMQCPVLIDEIIPYDTEQDLYNILAIEDINIRFLGHEYYNQIDTGGNLCDIRGIKIVYNEKRWHNYSSSELRQRIIKCSQISTSKK
jgi:glycerol-3-phosphate cytidylyltransferase